MPVSRLKTAWSALRGQISARSERIDQVHDLYAEIVSQARKPNFYRELGVADKLDGRFDLIVLHLFLVAKQLSAQGEKGKETEQNLLGLFFADMDRSLRELGVGDLSVGKKIRNMAEAYFGRAKAYEEALSKTDGSLAEAIRRNVYAGEAPDGAPELLASYVQALDDELKAVDMQKGFKNNALSACFARALHHMGFHETP